MLTPGSVWKRTVPNKKPTFTTVLLVSNQGQPQKVQEKFPPQVVFLTESLQLLTQPVEVFQASRVYHGVDNRIQGIYEAINRVEPAPETSVVDFGSIQITDDTAAVADAEEAALLNIPSLTDPVPADISFLTESEPAIESTFVHALLSTGEVSPSNVSLTIGGHHMEASICDKFVSYEELPWHTGDTMHVLGFRLEDGLTMERIRSAFDSSIEDSVSQFTVHNPYEGQTTVVIDGFLQVMMSAQHDSCTARVYLTSSNDFRSINEVSSV